MAQPFWVKYLLVNLNPLSSRVGCHDNIKDKCFWCSWWVIAFKYGKVAQNWTNLPTTVLISPITAPQKEFQFPPQDHVPILTSKQTTRDLTGKENETFNYLSVVIFLQICSWLEKTLLINFSIIYYLLWQNHLFDLQKKSNWRSELTDRWLMKPSFWKWMNKMIGINTICHGNLPVCLLWKSTGHSCIYMCISKCTHFGNMHLQMHLDTWS